jgi:hypothetical protein
VDPWGLEVIELSQGGRKYIANIDDLTGAVKKLREVGSRAINSSVPSEYGISRWDMAKAGLVEAPVVSSLRDAHNDFEIMADPDYDAWERTAAGLRGFGNTISAVTDLVDFLKLKKRGAKIACNIVENSVDNYYDDATKALAKSADEFLLAKNAPKTTAEGLVYRSGGNTPASFTPRPGIDTEGLSTFDSVEAAVAPGGKAQIIDLSKVEHPLVGVPDASPPGHVSIRPGAELTDDVLQQTADWAATRGTETVHPLTEKLMRARVGEVKRPK